MTARRIMIGGAIALCAAVLAGCGGGHAASSTSATTRAAAVSQSAPTTTAPTTAATAPAGSTSTSSATLSTVTVPATPAASTQTTTVASTAAAPSARAVAHTFAVAYARYLSGTASASQLPDATAAARQTAGSAGRPPTATVTVLSLSPAAGASWVVVMRDGAHRLIAQLMLAKPASGWIVNKLVPPDFSTQLQPVSKHSGPKVPKGGAAPLRTTRAFLKVYLHVTRATVGHLRSLVTPRLLAQLKRDAPPQAGPAQARVLVIPIRRHGVSWIATPSLSNGTNTYQLTITLIKGGRGHWLVDTVTQQQ